MTPVDLDALLARLKDDAVPSGGRWQVRQDAAAAITELRAEVARLKMNQRCSAIEQGEVGYPCVFRAEMERAEAEARTKIAEQLLRIAALEAERDKWKTEAELRRERKIRCEELEAEVDTLKLHLKAVLNQVSKS
jgi:hypothetical protein